MAQIIPTDRYISNTSFHVRYAETDAQGIVHHASYLVWMEEGRSHFARSIGHDYADFERGGFFMSVLGVDVRYRAASRYGDQVTIACWIEDVRSRTVTFGYAISNTDQAALVYATGKTEHICITRTGQITVWPEDWRNLLAKYATKESREL